MIGIVDYGLGNIQAFAHVYKQLSIPFQVVSTAAEMKEVTKLILPGVGAFDHAMVSLQHSGMRPTLDEMVLQRKIPVLGVCVGMQLFARSSEEGRLPGLGWLHAAVKKFVLQPEADQKMRLPHMGWNNLEVTRSNPLWQELPDAARFYFLHSYYFDCGDKADAIGATNFNRQLFTSAVHQENIFGVQFHPEKSHHSGIQLLKNFAEY